MKFTATLKASVTDNILQIEAAFAAIKQHCLCFQFEETETHFRVVYPPGDFCVDGVQAHKSVGKAKALKLMLERMERDWASSYPSKSSHPTPPA